MDRYELLQQLRDLPENERELFLDRHCENRDSLRAWLESQLKAKGSDRLQDATQSIDSSVDPLEPDVAESFSAEMNSEASSPIESPPDETQQPGSSRIGTWIGTYRILDQLGEGGMGSVYLAEQREPLNRRVALKVIKSVDGGSKEVLARFEAERQAMAMMNHPNIARILDAGSTKGGQPFFAMELVQGKPITSYCDQNKLSISDRLRLFCDVCQGVQHAHQKGIIHRDLKPSNILVAFIDGKAVPKVIDFGLAKAMESSQRLTDQSLFTGIGQILGTFKYMSPEQAGVESMDIDTRTDIYALGIILYELLTGRTPLDSETIKGESLFKVLQLIREQDPIKPSSRISDADADSVSSVTDLRRTDNRRFQKILAGDLDWIVMKALEKDRSRRYESASGFAADVRRFLENEPVEARPPSVRYRVHKFVRKNRVGVAATLLVFVALLVGVAGTTWGMFRAERAEEVATNQLAAAQLAQANEAKQRKEAIQSKEQAEDVLDFFVESFQVIDPYSSNMAHDVPASSILQQAYRSVEQRFAQDASTKAAILEALCESLKGVGEFQLALDVAAELHTLRIETLGRDHADTLSAWSLLLERKYEQLGESPKLTAEVLKCHETCHSRLGPEHFTTWRSTNLLIILYARSGKLNEAMELAKLNREIAQRLFSPENRLRLTADSSLALVYERQGRFEEALNVLSGSLQSSVALFGEDDLRVGWVKSHLADVLQSLGRNQEAFELRTLVLKNFETKLGDEHPDTLELRSRYAKSLRTLGREEEALLIYQDVLQSRESLFGKNHPSTLASKRDIAIVLSALSRFEESLALEKDVLEKTIELYGESHPETLNMKGNYAVGLGYLGRVDESIELQRSVLSSRVATLGDKHPDTIDARANLATSLAESGRIDEAIEITKQVLDERQEVLGDIHPNTVDAEYNLAISLMATGEASQAAELFEQVRGHRELFFGRHHPATRAAILALASSYFKINREAEALELLEENLKECIENVGETHRDTFAAMGQLSISYYSQGKLEQAIPLTEKLVRLRKSELGVSHPHTLRVQQNLAIFNRDAGRYAEALKLTEEVYQLRVDTLGADHPNSVRSLEVLVDTCVQGQFWDHDSFRILAEYREATFGSDHELTVESRSNLASSLFNQGKLTEGLALYDDVLSIIRQSEELSKRYLVPTLLRIDSHLGQFSDSDDHQQGVKIVKRLSLLAEAFSALDSYPDASSEFREEVIGLVQSIEIDRVKRALELIGDEERTSEFKKDIAEGARSIAWRLAINADIKTETAGVAVDLAQLALELGTKDDWVLLDTLAATQAREGNFAAASETQNQAIEKCLDDAAIDSLRQRLELYRSGIAYEESALRR